jgi:hypothetical protein
MRSSRLADFFLLPVFALAVIAFNAAFPEFGFKSFAFMTFAAVLLTVAFIPLKWGLIFTFTYIGLEGFLKVVSNYHPVIHVGSDLLVIFLCMKALVESFARRDSLSSEVPPLFFLFLIHFGWVLITLFNPYGLGLVPSLAGAKLYVTMLMLFFFGFYQTKSLKDAHHFILPFLFVAILHTGFGIYQGMVGEQSVLALHPRYAVQLAKYENTAFRPFGLTNLPGGPAVYLALVFPLFFYFIFTVRSHLIRWILLAYVPAGIFLFLLCQVRSSFLKAIVGSAIFGIGAFIYMARDSRKLSTLLVTAVIGISGVVYFLPQMMQMSIEESASNEDAIDRSLSVFDVQAMSSARRGTWDRFVRYASEAPFGAGFARIGAAAGAFETELRADPFFGEKHFFADNFWIATVVEEGIPGMVIITTILFLVVFKTWRAVFRVEDFHRKLLILAIFGSMTGVVLGLYGAEGILYNPDSSFFWFFAGMALKLPRLDDDAVYDEVNS